MARPIMVTGAAGFIGRNVVAELNRRGEDELILVDELGVNQPNQPEKWKNLVGLRYEEIVAPEEFLELLHAGAYDDARSLIHLGACSATTEKDADYLLENNYRYTRVLCDWAMENDVRFVYASSAATYGDGAEGYDDADEVTPKLKPLNMYGYSKHMFDLWALKHGLFGNRIEEPKMLASPPRDEGLNRMERRARGPRHSRRAARQPQLEIAQAGNGNRIVGLKYFNVFGPYEDHKGDMRSVVSKSYDQIRETGVVKLFKSYRPEYRDGEQMRDFVYVKDAVDVTLHFAMQDAEAPGGLFNCGTGEPRTWVDLVTAVYRAMNREVKIEFIEMPEILRSKYQYFTRSEVEKLRAAGYTKPFTSLEDGVREYVQGYLEKRA